MIETNIQKIKTIFAGTSDFAIPIFEKLVGAEKIDLVFLITETAKPAGRQRKIASPAIKKTAVGLKIPILQPKKISDIASKIAAAKPDLITVAAFGQIIPAEILKIPRFGVVNIHPSLLPKYRGASPIQSAILLGEKITGVSIMLMDEKMDTGPILAQEKIQINPQDDFLTLSQKLAKTANKILEKTIIDFVAGRITPQPQKNSATSYCSQITKKDGLLDFTKAAAQLQRQIRAFVVWPKSYCFWNNQQVIISKAAASDLRPEPPAAAGTVFLDPKNKNLAILTGKGSLIVNKLQLEGKKEMTAKDFLNGHPEIIGDTLKDKN